MAKYRNVTTDFSGGLVTDHILGRVDIERLQKSAKPFTNFFPTLQGPALYRDGFRYAGSADDDKTFSIAMSLSDGRSYRVVLSHLKLTVYNSEGLQLTQIDAPYKVSELDEVRWSSETDILYICHGLHAPRTLTVDVQYQTSVLLPSDYATVTQDQDGVTITGVDGLASTETDADEIAEHGVNRRLLADAVYELGDDSWSLNEVEFTSHPYLNTDLSDTVLSLSARQEYIRLESNVASDFNWIVNSTPSGDNTTSQTDWYVEYYVNNQWSLGKVVNQTTDSRIPNPTSSVVYVDPVDSVVNIEDESCRFAVADRSDAKAKVFASDGTFSSYTEYDYFKFEDVKEDSVNVRATSLVFSPNQVNSYIRAGGERLSTEIVTPLDNRTRWYKIKEHLGTSDYPVDFISGETADDEDKYNNGSIYRSYADDSFMVKSIGGTIDGVVTNASQQVTSIVTASGGRLFSFNYIFEGFSATESTHIGNLSTQKQFDVVDCYVSSSYSDPLADPDDIPEIVENSVAYAEDSNGDILTPQNGNLISSQGIISVFDVVTDPDGVASHTATLSASKTLFKSSDVGRFIFAKLGTNFVTLKISLVGGGSSATVDVLSSVPKNKLTGKIENNGVFRSFRLGAWYQNNQPQSVAFFEQRRVYAGSYDSPNYVWMSKNEDDTDFRTSEYDGDVLDTTGISYPLSNVNATVRWLAPAKALTVGTDNGIYKLTANEYTAAISPKNIRIELEDPEGAKTTPTTVGSAVFFADISGSRLLEFVYDINSQAANTNDITKLIYPTFLNDPIIRIEYSHTPQPRIWCLTTKGKIYCLTYHKKEDFYAWSKIECAGEVKDICVLRKGYLADGEDQLWITVKNGNRYDYEVLSPYYRDEIDSAELKNKSLFLDSHIRFPASGSAETAIADSLDVSARYNEGDTVRVVSDGVDRGDVIVGASGLVDVSDFPKTDHVLIGVSYAGLIGMTVNTWATQAGSSYGGDARVVSVRPYVYNSVGYSIGVDDKFEYVGFDRVGPEAVLEEESTYLLQEDGGVILNGSNTLDRFYTGFGKELPVRGSVFGVDKVPTIKHDRPYPLTLVSLVVKTDFNP
jgi:hypothetical protein